MASLVADRGMLAQGGDAECGEEEETSEGSEDEEESAPRAGWCIGSGPEKPALVPDGNPFFHKACCCRTLALFGSYWVLLLVGLQVAEHISAGIGLLMLTLGPTFIILSVFFRRYSFSTTRRQVIYTFLEAIAWMVPLVFFVSVFDVWSDSATTRQVEVPCTWNRTNSPAQLLYFFSFVAQCSKDSAAFDGGQHVEVAEDCPMVRRDGKLSRTIIPKDGSFSSYLLEEVVNDTFAGSSLEQFCPQLDTAIGSIVEGGKLRFTSIQRGDKIVHSSSSDTGRQSLIDSYSDLCAADPVIQGEKICSIFAKEGENVTMTFAFRQATVFSAAVTAYFRAGFMEELLKYGAVRRVLFKDRVVDCGGLIAYGLAAGAGFATAENLQYTLAGGLEVAVTRMYLSIPLHCSTGLIIGILLGHRKFLGKKYFCLGVLVVPVMLHGTYDFLLMVPESFPIGSDVRMLLAVAIVLVGFLLCRIFWLPLDAICIVNVRELEREGRISHPACCFCECDCCSAWLVHQDPLVKGRSSKHSDHKLNSQGDSAQPGITTSSLDLVVRGARVSFRNIIPKQPKCQTTKAHCPECGSNVRAHTMYPSCCPHCGSKMPDSVLNHSSTRSAGSSDGLGDVSDPLAAPLDEEAGS